MGSNGPIHAHRQYNSWARMGPFVLTGSFTHGQEWAHLCSPAVLLMGKNGPIRAHRQYNSWARMGPFVLTGSLTSWAVMCPFVLTSSLTHGQ